MQKRPFLFFMLALLLSLALTQFLAYQQYKISKETEHDALVHELTNVKDKFRSVLYNDIAAANVLAVIYKQYGTPKNFDSIARQVIENSKYVDAIQFNKQGIITNVYPIKGHENTIGLNTLADSTRRKEESRALEKHEIYFAGPRKLREGGVGILGKVPVVIDDQVFGLVVVLTKLPVLIKALDIEDSGKNKFAYVLSKNNTKIDTGKYLLTNAKPGRNSESVSITIPEGDWQLIGAYNENYSVETFPNPLSAFGFLFSIIAGLLAYRIAREPYMLKKVIRSKTHLLGERVKELSTIYGLHNILQDEQQTIDEVFTQIVNLLPPGWQYPEICEARIVFEGREYITAGYKPSDYKQTTEIHTQDGRKGFIEVIYTEETKPEAEGAFLKEERDLINTLAGVIEVYFNKKSHQDALSNSEARFRGAFEHAAIGMTLVSLKGERIMVNEQLCNMLGYTEQELLSLSYRQTIHPDEREKNREYLREMIAGNMDYYRAETRYIHKNGSIVWVNLNLATIKDSNGAPQYFVAQIENISEKIESQQKFQNLVEKSLVGVYILQNGKFAYVNPRIAIESGYTEEELITNPIDHFVHKDDLATVQENIMTRLSGQTDTARYEVRAYAKDGSVMWMEMFGSVTLYQGAPAIIGTMVNITDKKAVYSELERSAANLRTIFNTTRASYLLMDREFTIQSVNDFFAMDYMLQTGYSLAPGKNFLELTLPDKRDQRKMIFENVLATGVRQEYEMHYDNNGTSRYFFVQVSPVISEGSIIGLCYSGQDITSSKTAFVELQKSEANLRSIFDNSEILYLLLDTHYNILSYNKHMQDVYIELTGHQVQAGNNLIDIILPDKKGGVKAIYDKVVAENKPTIYETVYPLKEGAKHLMVYIMPVIFDGNVNGICISSIDITRMKKLEFERQKMIDDLMQRNRDLEQFAYIVSHNVRGPLSTMLGLNNLLKEEKIDPGMEYIVEGIGTSADKLDSVIRDLNDILHVRNDVSELKQDVDFNSVVENVKGSINQLIRNNNVMIVCDFAAVPGMQAINSYMNSIFYNLISNAIKFAKPNVPPEIRIWSEQVNGSVALNFSDNGIGIDLTKYSDRIFGLYHRFHPQIEGKGLGLFMTKTQVELMNGKIHAESTPGVGSTFKITLPA